MTRTILLASALFGLATTSAAQSTGDLTLIFEVGARTGQVMVALFPSQAAYDADKGGQLRAVTVGEGAVGMTFKGLAPGRYAVKSFHDVNGDGKMALNLMGMPTEPYGFSNNAVVRYGPPAWDAAAFDVAPGAVAQTITLR
ncbi:MAG: DUF2141 domain-containing protein [Phenylobacterium sp.]